MHAFDYSPIVMDHFENPRNVGEVESTTAVAMVENAQCGDRMKLSFRIGPSGLIEEARFRTFGCVAAIAASSMTTQIVRGLNLESAGAITNQQVAEALGGLPGRKVHCSVLAEQAIQQAIRNYQAPDGSKEPECPGESGS